MRHTVEADVTFSIAASTWGPVGCVPGQQKAWDLAGKSRQVKHVGERWTRSKTKSKLTISDFAMLPGEWNSLCAQIELPVSRALVLTGVLFYFHLLKAVISWLPFLLPLIPFKPVFLYFSLLSFSFLVLVCCCLKYFAQRENPNCWMSSNKRAYIKFSECIGHAVLLSLLSNYWHSGERRQRLERRRKNVSREKLGLRSTEWWLFVMHLPADPRHDLVSADLL